MARGWESKSVESQIEDRAEPLEQRRISSPADQKRESLERSRRRISRELETAQAATHRAALKNALAWLDDELRKLRD